MKKETLEEAAEHYSELQGGTYTTPHKRTYKYGFVDGAKWQAERMYSEEEVIEIIKHFDKSFYSGIVERNKGVGEWLKQNKNK